MKFDGTVFRAHNPRWSWSPLSGAGAEQFGGRFNPIGMPALYTSMTPKTAMLEASPLGRPFQPLTLVSYRVTATLFDATDSTALASAGLTEDELGYANWELDMAIGNEPPQHRLARTLEQQTVHGLLVRSFARGAAEDDLNVVFWHWGKNGADIRVIDDDGRLPSNDASWTS